MGRGEEGLNDPKNMCGNVPLRTGNLKESACYAHCVDRQDHLLREKFHRIPAKRLELISLYWNYPSHWVCREHSTKFSLEGGCCFHLL